MHNYSNLTLNSKHHQLDKTQASNMAVINKSTFLSNPSLGSWRAHTFIGSSLNHTVPLHFSSLLYFIVLLPNLKWFLIGLRAPSLLRGIAFPSELQELLRHSAYLGQVHSFAVHMKQDLLCLRVSTMKGFKGDIIDSSLLAQGILQLSLLDLQSNSYSSSKLCQEKGLQLQESSELCW